MKLDALLTSLTDDERNFIARLDYGNEADRHRDSLDEVIAKGGIVDFGAMGYWYPYEVIELGKNWLQEGHEREYAACLGIVLANMKRGADRSNDVGWIIETQADVISQLPTELRGMITQLVDGIVDQGG